MKCTYCQDDNLSPVRLETEQLINELGPCLGDDDTFLRNVAMQMAKDIRKPITQLSKFEVSSVFGRVSSKKSALEHDKM